MYKCGNCGKTGGEPETVYEKDGGRYYICRICKSEDVRKTSEYRCSICGGILWEGEHAYEAGDELICEGCITRVML